MTACPSPAARPRRRGGPGRSLRALALAASALAASCGPGEEPPGRSAAAQPAVAEPALAAAGSADPLPAPGAGPAGEADPAATREALRPGRGDKLASIAMRTFVYAAPERRATKLGYLRAGAIVERAAAPSGDDGCPGGWYAVHPRGFVCVGRGASLELGHDVVAATPAGPRRGEPYPYRYVVSRKPPPHLYVHLPSDAEQRRVEGRSRSQGTPAWSRRDEALLGEPDPLTPFFETRRDLPKPFGAAEKVRFPAHRGRARADSAFGLISTFAWNGRRFGLTTELDLIPIDRTSAVVPTAMRGVEVKTEGTPAFVMHHGVRTLKPYASGELKPDGWAAHRSGWVLTGKTAAGGAYVETDAGVWIPASALRVARLGRDFWGHAARGRKWIDISIELQMLVAYEGTRPVFATLVSTGRGELGDPATTSATVQGTFFIREKHVTATMDGDDLSETSVDLRDVPYVQYFHNSYALHGVYWHDAFGKVRSSGCVNLAPADAAWLFEWTDPPVPDSWHAAFNDKGGTLVFIHG
ncbi:L,D-transpeptidase [Sorangium sp. So ce233]|uniref:L,D-transpeptidase n=1 Tax=Sorangium sp. So ce233 TaxID=3133290 RepID=UPI003F5F4F17